MSLSKAKPCKENNRDLREQLGKYKNAYDCLLRKCVNIHCPLEIQQAAFVLQNY